MSKTTKRGKGALAAADGKMSRRALLKAGAGTAALLAAARMNFPGGAFAQGPGLR
jgi:nitrate/nitrite transport system substrate-binding protein